MIGVITFVTISCRKDFLEVRPAGQIDQSILADEKGLELLLTGAYSMLDGVTEGINGWEASSSNWLFGSVRGIEANTGGDAGDQTDIATIQRFLESPRMSYLDSYWEAVYEGVSRCNRILSVARIAGKKGLVSSEKLSVIIAQARVLRGWYHFEAWRMWSMIPYIDENTSLSGVSNKPDIRQRIIEDLSEGLSLPENMGAVGKFNGTISKFLLAKALMQMFHDYDSALPLLAEACNGSKSDGSKIGLAATYGEIFEIENRNGPEAVYTVQYSVNDGSGGYNASMGEVMNFPYKSGASPAGCCGFFQPSQEFVNSFRTSGGLPLPDYSYNSESNEILRDEGVPGGGEWDSLAVYDKFPYWDNVDFLSGRQGCTVYNPDQPYVDLGYASVIQNNKGNNPLTSPQDWKLVWREDNSKPVDPRLDWSVGRRGIPYWDWGVHTGSDWIRDQSYSGPYSPKKQVYKKSDIGKYIETGAWTTGFTANGYRMIRYSEILLLMAECQIETGNLEGALHNINLVRERAANPDGFVKEADGMTPAALYEIKPYPSFPDREYARKALYMECKLEFGMEGHRWFDLNRWGITVKELNRILDYERKMPWGRILYNEIHVGEEDVTYPIPQKEIDISDGKLVQNRPTEP